jgi:hypothetical protein
MHDDIDTVFWRGLDVAKLVRFVDDLGFFG